MKAQFETRFEQYQKTVGRDFTEEEKNIAYDVWEACAKIKPSSSDD